MQVKYIYDWDSDKGVASCIIYYNDSITGIGSATCHPIDNDFKSENTGKQIAQMRAEIDLIKKIKMFEIIPGIKAMKHVLGTMVHSSKYNEFSYEANRLKREIQNSEMYLESLNDTLENMKYELSNFINIKDMFYTAHR